VYNHAVFEVKKGKFSLMRNSEMEILG
jgi:hypothetical protein